MVAEISLPQIRCFDAPLQPNALRDVKNIVKRNTTAGVENDGVTLEGDTVCPKDVRTPLIHVLIFVSGHLFMS